MVMASETYRTLFGWLNGQRASADTAQLADAAPAGGPHFLDDLIASLPDAAIVLDRGQIVYQGSAEGAVDRYRAIMQVQKPPATAAPDA